MRIMAFMLCALIVEALAPSVKADDAYFRVPLSRAAGPDSPIPEAPAPSGSDWRRAAAMRPYAAAAGGEAYLTDDGQGSGGAWSVYSWSPAGTFVVVRAPLGAAAKCTVYVPDEGWNALVPRSFTLEPAEASAAAKESFLRARMAHDEAMLDEGVPGAAFFRWRADSTRRELGEGAEAATRPGAREMADTYDLFTGGQAVSENLQLYREMPGTPAADAQGPEQVVKLESVPGITVPEFDWKSKLGSGAPAAGVLSAAIPADQHAVFFPTFAAMMTLLDEGADNGLPLARMLTARSEDGMVAARYERQLCLTRGVVARLLGPQAVRAVAITGSDPYFPTGTDVAVVFFAAKADGLREVLLMQVKSAAAAAGVKMTAGTIEGFAYEGAANADRSISSYVAVMGNNVIVTNSPAQLACLAAVQNQKAPSLATLDEFKYFRSRYLTSNSDETAFIFLSDATIRRWCGPRWRIGASRRLRAGAILADLTAAHAPEIMEGARETREVNAETPMRTIGTLTLGPTGIRSSVYGGTAFMTPIRELAITEVPKDEAAAYERWRDGYQRNWSWAFDPIAISLAVTKDRLAADLTVMPLIGSSEYRRWAGISQGATIARDAGDPHATLAHFVMAINPQSPTLQNYTGMARMMAPQVQIEPLGWLGSSVAVYADPDPFWDELAAAGSEPEKFFEQEAYRLPVALHADVGSAIKLTAFLAAVRGFVDQSAPGMAVWETREHHGKSYVKVGLSPTAREQSRDASFDKVCVYYAPTARSLIITLNEDVLTRALDRQAAPKDAAAGDAGWLGSNVCLRFTRDGLGLVRGTGRRELRSEAQRRAWSNLAILNEWHRMFPGKDPVAAHRALFGSTLIDPGSGSYAWNEKFSTMESSVYGHPGEPKEGPELPGVMDQIESGDFGLTFEDGGLRARGVLMRSSK